MNLIILAAIGIFALPVLGMAKATGYTSVCLGGGSGDEEVLLTVCNQRGMVAFPQPRLYLRVYLDGRGEIETDPPDPSGDDYREEGLVKKTFHVDAGEIAEIRRLGRMPDFQNAKDVYPAYVIGTDSSLTTTLILSDQGRTKKIVVTNFSYVNVENTKHYGLSFCRLMARVDELRNRGLGVVREPPNISFCELMRNREYYVGWVISMNAVLEYGETRQFIYDPECAKPGMGALFTTEKIGIGFDFKKGKSKELQNQAAGVRDPRFGGRARVYIYGILHDDGGATADSGKLRFDISEFKTIDPIVLPYEGRLEPGWMYIDSFDSRSDDLKFSSPLKMERHHAARLEWLNADNYPKLRAAGRTFITFRVVSREIKRIGKDRWNDTYVCEILDLQ